VFVPSFSNPHTITIAAWVRPNSLQARDIVDRQAGSCSVSSYFFYAEANGTFGFLTCDEGDFQDECSTNQLYTPGKWYFVVATHDGDACRMYVNGAEDTNTIQTVGTGPKDSSADIYLGAKADDSANFDGSIDEIRIYGRALTADEIKTLYTSGGTRIKLGAPNSIGSLSQGLVGWWTMDGADTSKNNSGVITVIDRSGSGNTGKSVNAAQAPVPAFGKLGQALSFDGSNDTIPTVDINSLDGVAQMSVSAWVYQRSTTSESVVLSEYVPINDVGWGLSSSATANGGGDDMQFRIDDSSTFTTANVHQANRWEHWLAVYNGGLAAADRVKLYLNGVRQATSNDVNPPTTTTANSDAPFLGAYADSSQFWDGSIDDVRVWSRAIATDEIKRLYNMGSTLKQGAPNSSGSLSSGLVGWWTMDGADTSVDGSGVVTAYDRSGNNRTASSAPQTPPTKAIGKIGQGLEFDSSTNLLSAGKPASLNNIAAKTICAWIRPSSFALRDIMGKYDGGGLGGWVFRLGNNCATGQDLCYFNSFDSASNGYWSTSGGITLNAWNHVCVAYDNSSTANDAAFYINGVSKAVTETIGPPQGTPVDDSPASLIIGNITEGAGDSSFGGTIDDLRLYNRLLSIDEVKRLYNMGR
jgi:hypothetical protein